MTFSPAQRLNININAYLDTVLSGRSVKIFRTNERTKSPRDVRFVLESCVGEDVRKLDPMGLNLESVYYCRLTSHPDIVTDGAEHDEVYQLIRGALFNDPPIFEAGKRMIVATRTLLDAVNKPWQAPDARPQADIHLYDLEVTDESSAPDANGLMASDLGMVVRFAVTDWAQSVPYLA